MKILVTGAAGFIGSHIVDRYIAIGHDVVVLDDLSTGFKKNIPDKARFYHLSINDSQAEDVFKKERPEIVNHHAAQIDVRQSVADPAMDASINIVGTLKLLELCRKYRVKKVIFASTGGAIYGEPQTIPADESHPVRPESPYGIAKLAIEKYLYFYFKTHGLFSVVLRYSNVYGPRQNALGEAGVIAIVTGKLLRGEQPTIYGDGTQTRDYIFVEDIVRCNAKALEAGVQGIFNVGTGVETEVNTVVQRLIQLTGSDCTPYYAPPRPGEQKRSCIRPGMLQEPPLVPLDEGLKKTVEWFSKQESSQH